MFCPVCKAEYRAGFQKCSDCGIELVPSLPPEEPARSYSMLWQGEDAIFHDTLVTKLESASLEYADTPFDVMRERDWTFWARLWASFWIRYFCSRG